MNCLFDYLNSINDSIDYYLSEISQNLHAISHNRLEVYGLIISSLVLIVAVYTANKEYWNNLLFKPKIKVDNTAKTSIQVGGNLIVSRLTILIDRKTVKGLACDVEELYYGTDGNWELAKNFIPFPLRWTHYSKESLDVLYTDKQYNLDLCEIYKNDSSVSIHLITNIGPPIVFGFDDLKLGNNKIKVSFYGEHLKRASYSIKIMWDGEFKKPDINIQQI